MKVKSPSVDYKKVAAFRGVVVVRNTRWGIVVQKWPRKKPVKKSASRVMRESLFAYAAHWSVNPEPIGYQTAILLTKGTLMMPRDMLIQACFANALTFIRPDGSTMQRYYDVAADPQATLDLITDEPGAMLVRLPEGWVGLLPGNDGQILTCRDGIPDWDNPSGGGGGSAWRLQSLTAQSTASAHATKGEIFEFNDAATINKIYVPLPSQATASLELRLARLTGNTITSFEEGPVTITVPASRVSQYEWKLATPLTVASGDRIAIMLTNPTPPTTRAITVNFSNDALWGAPINLVNSTAFNFDSNAPAIGNTLTSAGTSFNYLFMISN